MRTFKSLLALIAMLLCSNNLFAHDFEVDGIYYNITSSENLTVEVTCYGYIDEGDSYEYTGNVILPSSVTYNNKNYRVTSIGEAAFGYCKSLKSLTIPEGVTKISWNAFRFCDNLISIIIPQSVTSIGYYAFYNCYSLTSITIPEGVTSIGTSTFDGCSSLKSITIPKSVESIGSSAFSDCNSLTDIYIEDITSWLNINCSNETSRPNYQFNGKKDVNLYVEDELLTEVEIPSSITSIPKDAFNGCYNLTSISIHDNVTSIGHRAFQNCRGITSITIPKSVTTIGVEAFAYCSNLTSIAIPENVTNIERATFYGCSSLSSAQISSSVTNIKDYAFSYCSSLTAVLIPKSVTSIGYSVFSYCYSLTSITSLISPEKLFSVDAFFRVDKEKCTLYVPYGAQSKYAETEGWKDFTNIKELAPTSYDLVDGTAYEQNEDLDADNITYTRTLPNLHWNALYVPFKIPYATLADDYEVAYINAVHSYDNNDDGTIDDLSMEVMKIKAGTLKANYPYLIKARDEEAKSMTISVADAMLYAAEENSVNCASVYQTFEITGSYSRKSAEDLEGSLAISTEGAWQPLATGTYLNPFRLFLTITNRDDSPVEVEPAAFSRVRIIENGETTGILDLTPAVKKETHIFDLSGRRVLTPQRGQLYIVNGKKVVF